MIEEILKAEFCEDIFGDIKDLKSLKKKYHTLCPLCHPDIHKSDRSKEAFQKLSEQYEYAQELIKNGTYGKKEALDDSKSFILSGGVKYEHIVLINEGHIAKIFKAKTGSEEVILKIARNSEDNDLFFDEADNLKAIFAAKLDDKLDKIRENLFPKLLTIFILDGCAVNVFPYYKDYITLQNVVDEYNMDLRTACWIFRRILLSLIVCHSSDIIHGCFTLDNFLINKDNHESRLIDFCYSNKAGKAAKLLNPKYLDYFAPEIEKKGKLTSGTDLYMAAKLMFKLLEGQKIPAKFKRLLDSCLLIGYGRINDAELIYIDFEKILKEMFGERKFHPFPDKK